MLLIIFHIWQVICRDENRHSPHLYPTIRFSVNSFFHFSGKRFRPVFSFLGLFLLFMFFLHCSSEPKTRLTCFSLLSSQEWLELTIADGINSCLKKNLADPCLIYPLDWMYGAIEMDSSRDVSYLKNYGRRIGLEYIIT